MERAHGYTKSTDAKVPVPSVVEFPDFLPISTTIFMHDDSSAIQ
jgi:hypothetical protein